MYQKPVVGIEAGFHKGFIFAHSKDVQNTDGSYPWGIEISLFRHQRNKQVWDLCRCYPKSGLNAQYFNYDNRILGHSLNLNTFLEPYFNTGNRLQISIRGLAGLSYLTNPYHPVENPTNMSYSLALSGYVALGTGIHAAISRHQSIHLYTIYNHISNGGIKDPNKGINWPTLSLALDYAFKDNTLPVRKYKGKEVYDKRYRLYADVYGSSKTISHGDKNRWLLAGSVVGTSRRISSINQLAGGIEIWYDYSLKQKIMRRGEAHEAWRAGIYLMHEFVLNRFLLSQGMGIYLYKPPGFYDAIYQRYGLLFHISRRLGVGLQVLAHRQVADYLDFRLRYYIK